MCCFRICAALSEKKFQAMPTKHDIKYFLGILLNISEENLRPFYTGISPGHYTISINTLFGCFAFIALQYIFLFSRIFLSTYRLCVVITQWKAHEKAKDEGLEPSSKELEGTRSTVLSEPQASSTASEPLEGTENEELVEPAQPDIIVID